MKQYSIVALVLAGVVLAAAVVAAREDENLLALLDRYLAGRPPSRDERRDARRGAGGAEAAPRKSLAAQSDQSLFLLVIEYYVPGIGIPRATLSQEHTRQDEKSQRPARAAPPARRATTIILFRRNVDESRGKRVRLGVWVRDDDVHHPDASGCGARY